MKRSKVKSHEATQLFDHIRELQLRLLAVFAAMLASGTAVFFLYKPIIAILRSPINTPLYYDAPYGSFAFVMKVCLMGALAVTIPLITYNIIMFIRPAFDEKLSLKRTYFMTIASAILSFMGAVFAFKVILPGTLNFFSSFDNSGINALISANSYLQFVTNIIITFILIFQLPIVMTIIDKVKPLSPKKLFKFEKWVVVGSLVISLVIPFTYDFLTSLLIALPIIILYNLSILIVILQHHYYKRKEQSKVYAVFAAPAKDQKAFSLDESILDFIEIKHENYQTQAIEPSSIIAKKQNTKPEIPAWVIERKNRMANADQFNLQNSKRIVSDFKKVRSASI